MTAARASQVIAEILRSNAAPAANVSQAIAEVIRKQVTPPDLLVDQVVVEILRLDRKPPPPPSYHSSPPPLSCEF